MYRVVVDIILKCPDEFKLLVPIMGGFHMAKATMRSIGKYVKVSGIENAVIESGAFGQKVIEVLLGATYYVGSL